MKPHLLGEHKRSPVQRPKVTRSARNTGSNATIKKYLELFTTWANIFPN